MIAEARAVVEEAAERFGPDLALACSFQKEATVLVDLVMDAAPWARVFTLDTHVLFPETYAYWKEVEDRYGIEVAVFQGPTLGRQAAIHGDRLWETDPDRCCAIRKVEPMSRALAGMRGWITGVRREQSPSRAATEHFNWDGRHGLWKVCPLAGWTEQDVWSYIAERELPYNMLHDRGYGSIGCTHCTAPGAGREGRWAGSGKSECGLHA